MDTDSFGRLAFSPTEEGFWRVEEAALAAFRATILLWVDGCIRGDLLEAALAHLQARHPKLRAVVTRRWDGRHRYDMSRATPPIPFRITDLDVEELPWRDETRRLLETRFPPEGPFAAAAVLRNRSSSVLILTVHHAIADGLSAIMLMNDLMAEYARVEANRDAQPRPSVPAVCAPRAVPASWRDTLWLVRRFLHIQRLERRSRQTRLPEARNGVPQTQWVHWTFSCDETRALVRRCRKEQVSLGEALIASVCCGLMDCLPDSHAVFKCQFPFDLRDELVGTAGPITRQHLGSFSSIMNEFYEMQGKPGFWDLARRVHRSIEAFAAHSGPSSYYNLARVAAGPLFARATPALSSPTTTRPTLLATQYGVLDTEDVYGSLRPRRCTLAFRNDRTGPSLIIEALIMGRQLNVGFAGDPLESGFWDRLHVAVRKQLDAAPGAACPDVRG